MSGTFNAKSAVTVAALFAVTVHVFVPEQPPPDHPVNVEFGSALAVSFTFWTFEYVSLQSAPQLILLVSLSLSTPCPRLRYGESMLLLLLLSKCCSDCFVTGHVYNTGAST